jgi:hypothetical protein
MDATPLVREMRLYHKEGSVCFNGSIDQLINDFYIGYDFNNAPIIDSDGNILEKIALKP